MTGLPEIRQNRPGLGVAEARLELRAYCHFRGSHQRELISERQVLGVQSKQPAGWNGSTRDNRAARNRSFGPVQGELSNRLAASKGEEVVPDRKR